MTKIYRKKAKKAASAHTCSILKKKISTAKNRKTRGAALGNFSKHGCSARARRSKRR